MTGPLMATDWMNPHDPPAGIHPLIWLAIVLIFGPPAVISQTAAKLPSILGATARWWQRRQQAAADKSARQDCSPSYQVSQQEIVRMREDYGRLREDYDQLIERMDRLEVELTDEKRRSWAAIAYIRRLIDSHSRHAPGIDIPPPPEVLRDIV